MNHHPELMVMLTYQDYTVENAYEIFDEAKDSNAQFWGMKEKGLPLSQMKNLFAYMKSCGKTTALEVVAYTEEESLAGAQMAVECNCDILMGTTFFDSVNDFCKENNLKYMPFIGKITGRPSVLSGSVDEMISEAVSYQEKGVYGFDLLSYRYIGDSATLNQRFVSETNALVCFAGGVTTYQHLDEIKSAKPWFFTIGTAFFEHEFGNFFKEQINTVCEYMSK